MKKAYVLFLRRLTSVKDGFAEESKLVHAHVQMGTVLFYKNGGVDHNEASRHSSAMKALPRCKALPIWEQGGARYTAQIESHGLTSNENAKRIFDQATK